MKENTVITRLIWIFLIFHHTTATDITQLAFQSEIQNDAIPAAYGDFNSDDITDVFVLRNNFHTIEILLANVETPPFLKLDTNLRCHYPDLKITSVVPGDFDGDAFMDYMFTAKLNDNNEVGIFINYGESDPKTSQINCTKNNTEPLITMLGEPLAVDYNDDMIIDLLGSNVKGERAVWIFKKNERGMKPDEQLLDVGEHHLGNLKIPHSHSVLDMNDDWLADLVLSSDKGFEVWLANNSHDGRYHYNYTIEKPVGSGHYGQALFVDLELNGVLNQLIPYCKNKDCSESTICVKSFEHCHDLNVDFVQDNNDTKWGFLTPKSEKDYDHQQDFFRRIISMRAGDFNNDGYPDLLATLEKKKSKHEIQTFLLENIANPKPKDTDRFKRTFKVKWTDLYPFGADTVMGSFYDFYQDGILDVILLHKNGSQYKPLAFRNSLDYDANFVKIIVLTGLDNKKAPSETAPFGSRKRNYGTNLPGPSIKYKTTTQEGVDQNGISAQLPQSAYFSLHLPYTCFGLGRTPNFVDDVKIGLAGQSRGWQQLIPNSQMFVIPTDATKPSTWKAQLFVTPSKLILRSVIALLGKYFTDSSLIFI